MRIFFASTFDHFRRKIDAHAVGGFKRGQQISARAADFEHSRPRRHQKPIHLNQFALIRAAPSGLIHDIGTRSARFYVNYDNSPEPEDRARAAISSIRWIRRSECSPATLRRYSMEGRGFMRMKIW